MNPRISTSGITAFLAGVLTWYTVSLVGKMPVGEIVLLTTCGWLALAVVFTHRWPKGLLSSRTLVWMLICQGVALLGYINADIAWRSPMHDVMRGWARMAFLAMDIITIAYLTGPPRDARLPAGADHWVMLQWGLAVGGAILPLVLKPRFGEYWKFGFAIPVTLAVLIILPLLGRWSVQIAISALGIVHMALRFRSLGAVCLLVSALLLVVMLPRRYRVWMLVPGLSLAAAAMFFIYHREHNEYEKANERSDISRTAMIQAAVHGFEEHPFMGNGSWFSKSKVMYDFILIRYEKARELHLGGIGIDVGVSADEDNNEEMPFTLHSQILVGLAEGGILGGAFFLLYGGLLLWALYYCVFCQTWHRLSALFIYTILIALWNLVMSPFSGEHRVLIANTAVLLLLLRYQASAERAAVPAAAEEAPVARAVALPPWAYVRRA